MKETPKAPTKPKDFNIIATLRKSKSYTQADLAEKLKISRQTLSKYENNIEGIYAELVVSIAQFFGIGYEYVLENKPLPISINKDIRTNIEKYTARITGNTMYRFEQMFLYVLENIGAKSNVDQVVLFYLLYFIEFDYYEKYEKKLFNFDFIKEVNGPSPVGFIDYIKAACSKKVLHVVEIEDNDVKTIKYLPLVSPDLDALTASEIKSIDKTLERFMDKSLEELQFIISDDTPWIVAKSNELIKYDTVFYRNKFTSVRFYA